MHACVVVYMYLIYVMTEQNISDDGNKGVQICISPTFIEFSIYQGIKVWHASMLITYGRTDRQNIPVLLICLLTGVLHGRKTKVS